MQAIYTTGHGVPNNDVNRAARKKLGLPADPPTTHGFPKYVKGIQHILDYFELKKNADRIVKEREG